jgi:NAD(P)-dependent dehydrogenase (short-subunit alcohol dehydrogenase family)
VRLANKVAMVTGGGTGIGRAIALRCGVEGASVVVVGRREAPLRAVADVIRAAGGRAQAIAADVARSADVERVLAEVVRRWARLDVLVNNAGAMVARTRAADTSEEEWRQALEANP